MFHDRRPEGIQEDWGFATVAESNLMNNSSSRSMQMQTRRISDISMISAIVALILGFSASPDSSGDAILNYFRVALLSDIRVPLAACLRVFNGHKKTLADKLPVASRRGRYLCGPHRSLQ